MRRLPRALRLFEEDINLRFDRPREDAWISGAYRDVFDKIVSDLGGDEVSEDEE